MRRRDKDLVTLTFATPVVMAARMMQLSTGSMSATEFSRMWAEKPVAFATSLATLQVETTMAIAAAFGNPFFKRRSADAVWGAALGPLARTVSANRRRLAR